MFDRMHKRPYPDQRRAILISLVTTACIVHAALPPAGLWPQSRPASMACSFTGTSGWSQDSVFRAFASAVRRAHLVTNQVDAGQRRLVIAGPDAPAFRGSDALRRSRVHLEFGVIAELADSGRARFYIVEGTSMRPDALSHRDTLMVLQQTSELAQRLAKS